LKRVFLFLQGVISPFFPRLADQLAAEGHAVYRVNFCAGDALLWGERPAWNYRGGLAGLADYLATKWAAHHFTDVVLFGDQRPVHRPAIELARAHGARILVFEEGYVRPNWITLERGGVNAFSSLPRDPRWYLEMDARLERYGDGQPAPAKLATRALHDMRYHAANIANPFLFPVYRTHRPHLAAVEYAGWARRFAGLPWRKRQDARLIQSVVEGGRPYFFLPLQLDGDTQITQHSPYRSMQEVIEKVLGSFALWAPEGTDIIIKNHPLDIGLVDYARLIAGLERALDVRGRVHFVESGHLPTLLEHTLGVITVNSTTGMSALAHHRPTMTLGKSIYGLPGLTHQGSLDSFWDSPELPNPRLIAAFRNTVIHTTQVNGNLYTTQGITLALRNCARLLEIPSPLEALLG